MYVDVWKTRVERLDELDVKVKLSLCKISFDPALFLQGFHLFVKGRDHMPGDNYPKKFTRRMSQVQSTM